MLTKTDYEDIETLFRITKEIKNLYNEIKQLDKEGKIDSSKFNEIIHSLEIMHSCEKNTIASFSTNSRKLTQVIEFIQKNKSEDEKANIIYNRIMTKLNSELSKLLYLEIKNSNINFDQLDNPLVISLLNKLNNLRDNELSELVNIDIKNIARYYLNEEIKNTSSKFIQEQLIDFKYDDLFLSLENDCEIANYIDIKKVLLSYDYLYFFKTIAQQRKIDGGEKDMIKLLTINQKIRELSNTLLNINDCDFVDERKMVNATIIQIHIKAALFLLDKKQRDSIENSFTEALPNTIAKYKLMDAFNFSPQPNIESLSFGKKRK